MDVEIRTDASKVLTWKATYAPNNGLSGERGLEAKMYCSDDAVKVVDAMSAIGNYLCLDIAKSLLQIYLVADVLWC